MLNLQDYSRPDGALWYRGRTDCAKVLITSRGKELLDRDPSVETDMRHYLEVALGKIAGSKGVRSFFEKGTNGQVYTLNQAVHGTGILVKETNGHSMEDSLDRLDRIKEIVDKQRALGAFPTWIDVPDHYGVLTGTDLPNQYVVMQGIDNGINVRDVVLFDDLNAKERSGVTSVLGKIGCAMQQEVAGGYQQAGDLLSNAIAEETRRSPDLLLSDWHQPNVVLEQLETPINGNNFRYWVIDQ